MPIVSYCDFCNPTPEGFSPPLKCTAKWNDRRTSFYPSINYGWDLENKCFRFLTFRWELLRASTVFLYVSPGIDSVVHSNKLFTNIYVLPFFFFCCFTSLLFYEKLLSYSQPDLVSESAHECLLEDTHAPSFSRTTSKCLCISECQGVHEGGLWYETDPQVGRIHSSGNQPTQVRDGPAPHCAHHPEEAVPLIPITPHHEPDGEPFTPQDAVRASTVRRGLLACYLSSLYSEGSSHKLELIASNHPK